MRKIVQLWSRLYTYIKGQPSTCLIDPRSKHRKLLCEGYNRIGRDSWSVNLHLGYGTIIGTDSHFESCTIGRYCSIASNVQTISGMHPTRVFVSTHPAFFSLTKQCGMTYVTQQKFEEERFAIPENYIKVVIENDVWIGANVSIMEGCTIGNGAVIAAGAIVTQDVEPYSIVGGIPAKHIRYRFEEAHCEKLLELRWWDKEISWIQEYAKFFDDIETLFVAIEERN